MKRAVEVNLYGRQFTLRSDMAAEEAQRVADFVNRRIDSVAEASGRADSLDVVLLTLLNVAGEFLRCREEGSGSDLRIQKTLERVLLRLDEALPPEEGTEELPFKLD